MLQIPNRNKAQSICSEGQISNPANDQDSVTTLKFNQNQDQNKQLKVYQKQKEKNQAMLTQAAIKYLLHCDRFISNEKSYFKFPKMDFYLNIDCLFSSVNNQKTVDGSNISVINQFKKVNYSEISKKSNGVHVYMTKRDYNEMPWQTMVQRMQSFGNSELNEISNEVSIFCQQDFSKNDLSELSQSDQSDDLQTASKVFSEQLQKEDTDKIDELFLQNKNKPMLIWRGINKEFVSFHINECYLNYLQYTPEEFQMEVALSGIPEFVTSHNYNIWVKEILKVLSNLFTYNKEEKKVHYFQKEFITQNGTNVFVDFESYDLVIGSSDLVVEIGVQEVKQMKKKPKRKQDTTAMSAPTNDGTQIEKNNTCLKINEEKRKLTDEEKYFINNHYFKIQDFDFNKSKVCKYRILSNEFKNKIQFQLHA